MLEKTEKGIEFYRQTTKGYLLRVLALDDMVFWGADRLMSVIFALYIVEEIVGGSVMHVGLIFTLREIIKAVLSIPIGRFMDRHKGHVDEVVFLAISGFLTSISYFFFIFADQLWQVYIIMLFIGVAHTFNTSAWRTIFFSNISDTERGETIGIYQTVMSITAALIMGISGVLANNFGYDFIITVAAIMAFIAGILPLLITKIVNQK